MVDKKTSNALRSQFMNEFTITLIKTYMDMHPEKYQELRVKAIAEMMRKKYPQEFTQPNNQINIPQRQPSPPIRRLPAPPINRRPRIQRFPIRKPVALQKPQPIPLPEVNSIATPLDSMKKITPILSDPAVASVECTGPEKPLLVNRSGMIQTTNIMLSKEEIDNIMKDISEKTKIPVIQGVFKAAYGNTIISAVISNYVGTRFIIQKRMPRRF